MKEEQIKEIKAGFISKLDTLISYNARLAFITGARQLNSVQYDQGFVGVDDYLAIDKFLEKEYNKITETV